MSQVVHARVKDKLGKAENKVEYLAELQSFMVGMPPLKGMDPNKQIKEQSVKTILEYRALCKQFQEMMKLYKKIMEQALVRLEDTKPSTSVTHRS